MSVAVIDGYIDVEEYFILIHLFHTFGEIKSQQARVFYLPEGSRVRVLLVLSANFSSWLMLCLNPFFVSCFISSGYCPSSRSRQESFSFSVVVGRASGLPISASAAELDNLKQRSS